MKERPILFSAPMVRAILEGRKTQTRRIAKEFIESHVSDMLLERFPHQRGCKFGEVGDRLWVRETWAPVSTFDPSPETGALYRADPMYDGAEVEWTWKPSIHMPRWASRITLEITDVRVERLNEITSEDARSEGIETQTSETFGDTLYRNYEKGQMGWTKYPHASFQSLWSSIHAADGPNGWDANPWVWVIQFKQLKENTHE